MEEKMTDLESLCLCYPLNPHRVEETNWKQKVFVASIIFLAMTSLFIPPGAAMASLENTVEPLSREEEGLGVFPQGSAGCIPALGDTHRVDLVNANVDQANALIQKAESAEKLKWNESMDQVVRVHEEQLGNFTQAQLILRQEVEMLFPICGEERLMRFPVLAPDKVSQEACDLLSRRVRTPFYEATTGLFYEYSAKSENLQLEHQGRLEALVQVLDQVEMVIQEPFVHFFSLDIRRKMLEKGEEFLERIQKDLLISDLETLGFSTKEVAKQFFAEKAKAFREETHRLLRQSWNLERSLQ